MAKQTGNAMPFLTIDHIVCVPQEHEIYKKLTTVGSSEENDLSDPRMEPTHAIIYCEKGCFEVEPSSWRAEVQINGKRVRRRTAFRDGDSLQFGEVKARFAMQEGKKPEKPSATDEISEAFRRLQRLAEDLSQEYNVEKILTHAMDDVIAIVNADKGFLLLMHDGRIQSHVSRNFHQESIDDSLFSDSIVRHVVETKQPLIVRDALNDENFNTSQSVMNMRFCSVMCMPLMDRGAMIGLIYVGNDNIVNQFQPQHLEALRVFASQISLLLANAVLVDDLTFRNERLESEIRDLKFGNIIGDCYPMREVFNTVQRVAATDVTVLVQGETGTGKELIAQELHRLSNRARGPFVAINCGAIPENLLESELFGHVRGAFTGAVQAKVGKFQLANHGTLFLDEIGEMPTELQVKLLRVLQERRVVKVGSNAVEPVDIRIVAATNKDLEREVAEGRFREDLYYRLNVISLRLPPLCERGDDVILIARGLIDRYSKEFNMVAKNLSQEAVAAIRRYRWPGNVRQLENRIKKALILSNHAQIMPEDLDLSPEVLKPVMSLAEAKDDFQRRYINEVLELNHGNRSKTARDLGVDPRTIFRHLEKQGEK